MELGRLKTTHPKIWQAARHVAPRGIKNRLVAYSIFSDRASRRAFSQAFRKQGPERVSVHIRALGDEAIQIRREETDCLVVQEVFAFRHHMPPLGTAPRLIFDLGANNGATMAHFAHVFPDSRVIGLEPDPENAALTRQNVEPWADRCEVVEAAVWTDDGTVRFGGDVKAALAVGQSGLEVRSRSIGSLIDEFGRPDYVKFDIEGGERDLLTRSTQWADRVPLLNVEVHRPYAVEDCMADLAAIGYRSWRSEHHWPIVYGIR